MTLQDVFNEMIDMQISYSEHTIICKKTAFKKHILPTIGGLDILLISYQQMQTLLNSMLKSGYAPKTVSHIRDILRTTFDYAERIGYLTVKNVSRLLVLKRIDNRAFLRLSKDECVSFISSVKNEPNIFWRGFFMFLLTGRRLNEVKSLQWSWLDLKSKTVNIPAINSKDRYSHSYSITDELCYVLNILPRKSIFVFPSPSTGYKLKDVRKAFFKILDRAKIEHSKMRIHDIRHLVATLSLNAGMSLEDIKYALGHRSIQTTMRYVTNDVSKSQKVTNFIFNVSITGL